MKLRISIRKVITPEDTVRNCTKCVSEMKVGDECFMIWSKIYKRKFYFCSRECMTDYAKII